MCYCFIARGNAIIDPEYGFCFAFISPIAYPSPTCTDVRGKWVSMKVLNPPRDDELAWPVFALMSQRQKTVYHRAGGSQWIPVFATAL